MSVQYNATLKNARMQLVLDALGPSSVLFIGTAGMALILATIPLSNPAGVLVGNVLTFTVPHTDPSADASGIAAEGKVTDGVNDVITGLVVGNGPGADLIVSSTTFVIGQTITLVAASITHS